MNTAKTRTAVCIHGVAVPLDPGHSCFECEKEAVTLHLPIGLRVVDGANAMLLHAHSQANELAKQPAPVSRQAGLERLLADLKAQGPGRVVLEENQGTPVEIAETAEIKALQRVIIAMRRELAEVTADRNLFAAENHDLTLAVDDFKSRLQCIANFAKPATAPRA